jgi:LacI family transcriptional regulator
MRVALKDIAKVAGVSINTVSRALKNRSDIGEKTRKRIQTIADEMGYVPNHTAQSLKLRRFNTIGLLTNEMDNPVRTRFIERLRRIAAENDFQLLVSGLEYGNPGANLQSLIGRGVDGIIIGNIAGNLKKHELWPQIKNILNSKIPLVLFDNIKNDLVDSVYVDYFRNSKMLVQYLIEEGHRRISFFGYCKNSQRFEAYRQTMLEAGLKAECLELKNIELDGVREAIKELLKTSDLPEAIVARNDLVAIAAMAGLRDMGIKVPEDIAVAGFDNIEMAKFMNPALTSVGIDFNLLAQSLFDMLLERINGKVVEPAKCVEIEGKLFIRESSKKL